MAEKGGTKILAIVTIIIVLISSIGCFSDNNNHKDNRNYKPPNIITHEIILEVDNSGFIDIFEDTLYYTDTIKNKNNLFSFNVGTREKKQILDISNLGKPCSIYDKLIGFSQRTDNETSYEKKVYIYNSENDTTVLYTPAGVRDGDIKIFGNKAVIKRYTLEGNFWISNIILIDLTTNSTEYITNSSYAKSSRIQFTSMDFYGKYICWFSDISVFGRCLVIYNLETKEFTKYFDDRSSNNIISKIYGNHLIYLDQSRELLGYLNLENNQDTIISNDYHWNFYNEFDIYENIIVWISAEINTEYNNDHYDINLFDINWEKNEVILSSQEYKGNALIYGNNIVFLSGSYGEKINLIQFNY